MEALAHFGKRIAVTKTEQEWSEDGHGRGGQPARSSWGHLSQDGLLFRNQRFQSLSRETNHRGKLVLIKNPVLGSGLQFDELIGRGHDEVHVHICAGIFLVAEIEQRFAIHDSNAYCGDKVIQRG